jgi:hypothetical protein
LPSFVFDAFDLSLVCIFPQGVGMQSQTTAFLSGTYAILPLNCYVYFTTACDDSTHNRQQATGNRQQATGNREEGRRKKEEGRRKRQQAIGNRQQATGKKEKGKRKKEEGKGNRQ